MNQFALEPTPCRCGNCNLTNVRPACRDTLRAETGKRYMVMSFVAYPPNICASFGSSSKFKLAIPASVCVLYSLLFTVVVGLRGLKICHSHLAHSLHSRQTRLAAADEFQNVQNSQKYVSCGQSKHFRRSLSALLLWLCAIAGRSCRGRYLCTDDGTRSGYSA